MSVNFILFMILIIFIVFFVRKTSDIFDFSHLPVTLCTCVYQMTVLITLHWKKKTVAYYSQLGGIFCEVFPVGNSQSLAILRLCIIVSTGFDALNAALGNNVRRNSTNFRTKRFRFQTSLAFVAPIIKLNIFHCGCVLYIYTHLESKKKSYSNVDG